MSQRIQTLACSVVLACLATPLHAVTINVDCAAGDTIGAALTVANTNLTIDFTGVCTEDVEIRRGNVLLRGSAGAVIQGTITISDLRANNTRPAGGRIVLRRVTVDATGKSAGLVVGGNAAVIARDLTVTSSDGFGVFVNGGGWLRCEPCDLSQNTSDGLVARDNVKLEFSGNNSLSNNGGSGLIAVNGTSISINNTDGTGPRRSTLSTNGNGIEGMRLLVGINLFIEANATINANDNVGGGNQSLGGIFGLCNRRGECRQQRIMGVGRVRLEIHHVR